MSAFDEVHYDTDFCGWTDLKNSVTLLVALARFVDAVAKTGMILKARVILKTRMILNTRNVFGIYRRHRLIDGGIDKRVLHDVILASCRPRVLVNTEQFKVAGDSLTR